MTWQHQHRHHRRRGHRQRGQGFGPWGRRSFFGPGEVRLALLSLLAERPQHGYELMKGLEERSGGTYRASAGSVYPTLQQLEDEGLVCSEQTGGKRVYRITSEGSEELDRESDCVERIWRRADDWGSWGEFQYDPAAMELARPAMRLMKSALRSVARSDDANRVDEIRTILDRARHRIEGLDDV